MIMYHTRICFLMLWSFDCIYWDPKVCILLIGEISDSNKVFVGVIVGENNRLIQVIFKDAIKFSILIIFIPPFEYGSVE